MGTITILPETTKNPITLMGQRAGRKNVIWCAIGCYSCSFLVCEL